MSGWIKSVNNLLEQLDGQVETAVVDEHGIPTSRNAVDHVLSSRGLQSGDDDEEAYDEQYSDDYEDEDETDGEEWEEKEYYEEMDDQGEEEVLDLEAPESLSEPNERLFQDIVAEATEETGKVHEEVSNTLPYVESDRGSVVESRVAGQELQSETLTNEIDTVQESKSTEDEAVVGATLSVSPEQSLDMPADSSDTIDVEDPLQEGEKPSESNDTAVPMLSSPPSEQLSIPSTSSMNQKSQPPVSGQLSVSSAKQEQFRRCNLERKKAQAEARQLRKHVIALNSQLVSLESEMKAQREELQRAAERMERDRNRHSEEREDMMDDHDEELDTQKQHYEKLLSEQKERHEEQMEDLRERLEQVEERRLQEGGDWTKELEDALQRERESLKKFSAVQDESSTLQSAMSKLETQQSALQSRLEAATQNAQTAAKREREAEDKLDASLSLHSRQLSQRQAREAELERTVADLGAALVVARQKKNPTTTKPTADGDVSFRERLSVALEELETVKAQLALERQRSETLSQELQDMSKERTDEASAAQARQREHDRQVGDLNLTVSRLKASLRDMQRAEGSGVETGDTSKDGRVARLMKESEESKKAVATLSEQLMRQQKLVENSKTEILTLKNRLKSANARADDAEKALTSSANAPALYEMDASGALAPSRLRRRIKGGSRGRPTASRSNVKSIRSALNMEPGRVGGGAEQVAVTIDAIDSFMVETGAMFRHEPLARAAFFLYLVILHIWTFCLVIFHAHSFEEEHGDFGSLNENGGVAAGPDAVVHHSYRRAEQMP